MVRAVPKEARSDSEGERESASDLEDPGDDLEPGTDDEVYLLNVVCTEKSKPRASPAYKKVFDGVHIPAAKNPVARKEITACLTRSRTTMLPNEEIEGPEAPAHAPRAYNPEDDADFLEDVEMEEISPEASQKDQGNKNSPATAENKRVPRKSALSSIVEPTRILARILDEPVQLKIGEVLGLSKDISNILGESIKLRSPKESIPASATAALVLVGHTAVRSASTPASIDPPRNPTMRVPACTTSVPVRSKFVNKDKSSSSTSTRSTSSPASSVASDPDSSPWYAAFPVPLNPLVPESRARNGSGVSTFQNVTCIIGPAEGIERTKGELIQFYVRSGEHNILAIMDTGSQLNIVRRKVWRDKMGGIPVDITCSIDMTDANGQSSVLTGLVQDAEFGVGIINTRADIYVGDDIPFDLLLGRPWQQQNFVSIDECPDGTYLVIKDPWDVSKPRFEFVVHDYAPNKAACHYVKGLPCAQVNLLVEQGLSMSMSHEEVPEQAPVVDLTGGSRSENGDQSPRIEGCDLISIARLNEAHRASSPTLTTPTSSLFPELLHSRDTFLDALLAALEWNMLECSIAQETMRSCVEIQCEVEVYKDEGDNATSYALTYFSLPEEHRHLPEPHPSIASATSIADRLRYATSEHVALSRQGYFADHFLTTRNGLEVGTGIDEASSLPYRDCLFLNAVHATVRPGGESDVRNGTAFVRTFDTSTHLALILMDFLFFYDRTASSGANALGLPSRLEHAENLGPIIREHEHDFPPPRDTPPPFVIDRTPRITSTHAQPPFHCSPPQSPHLRRPYEPPPLSEQSHLLTLVLPALSTMNVVARKLK
ncbi:hypothetical protein EVG20_g5637 [Dentipellis fragilis]|uniref:Uncharacterized protein n=1 Tax=Dentipellis fragilis TaxID=205917 RepID=A0A4Y9YRY5_9AGAM|nr:hypothetical protein EVG20_g5637 [Dentipellis fragilis]